ncbi:hypothetical protein GGX14DRAFT_362191 [Mycena pura]|uniref:Major facilitator superfamily (MFS) profile domain-containing protein n=1 Tax=Mycena pura TaxID=153505 RepID=A0AAD6YEA4_9AGAR|nr:hypothetical protein GGX14DRAFT_362191 [Mycena pura]
MTVVGSVIISDSVSLKSRGLYQGFANLLFDLGSAVGAPLGGWIGDTISWRAAFLFQMPLLSCGLTLLFLKVREPPLVLNAAHTTLLAKLKRIDYAGAVSLVAALLTFLVGMNYKTTAEHEWGDPHVWGYLVVAAVLLLGFLAVEFKFAVEPIMAVTILKQVCLLSASIETFQSSYNHCREPRSSWLSCVVPPPLYRLIPTRTVA